MKKIPKVKIGSVDYEIYKSNSMNKITANSLNRCGFIIIQFLFLGLLLISGDFAFATALTVLKAESLPSNMVRIQLHFSQPVNRPAFFSTTKEPATIVLDFPNTSLQLAKSQQFIPVGVLLRYQAVESIDQHKTRVVLYLRHSVKYIVQTRDCNVFITLSGGRELAVIPRETAYKPIQYNAPHFIRSLDFNRSQKGGGEIVVTLSDPRIDINLMDKLGTIQVSFTNTRVPMNLLHKFDVTAFGTVVKSVELTNTQYGTNLFIRANLPYQPMAYQVDNRYIININGMGVNQQTGRSNNGPKKYVGRTLSLQFQTISVRAALQLLAQFANVNLVVTDSVAGDITLRLNQVPWDQALEIIMQTKGLGERKIGDTIIIAPAEEIARREKEELLAQSQLQVLEPLQSILVQINYGKASEIAALLKGSGKSVLSERGSVSVDARTNTLWIQDTSEKLAEVRQLIERLDMPVKQVLIEARIVNIDKNFELNLGIRWGFSRNQHLSGTLAAANNSLNMPISQVDPISRLNVNLPATLANAGTFGMALVKLTKGVLLDLELSALQTEGNVRIIASPRLITANQKEAYIEAGEEIPYQEATSSGATAVAFKKAVLSLKVTPQITPDNRIILDLKVNQDKRGPEVLLGVPSIDTREIQSQVLVDNGQTVVLGGIYQQDAENNVKRIPFLGDLPLIGYLFRTTDKIDNQSELLIFITPKIINQSFYQQ